MDLPQLSSQGVPVRFPDCCLSLSTKLLQILTNIFSNTTLSEETPTVLSVGSGSGILEAFLLAYVQSQPQLNNSSSVKFNIEGVEVQQASGKDPVNTYLPEQSIYTVRGTWDVVSRLQEPDVRALLFVYPRQPALVSEYTKAIAAQGLNVEVIVWLGPMADWEVFEPCFIASGEYYEHRLFTVAEKMQGLEAGLDEYELMAVMRRSDCNSGKPSR